MGIQSLAVSTGATLSASGGTTLTFSPDGTTIQNGVRLIVPADTTYTTRRNAVFKYSAPVINPVDGSYKKDKKSVSYTQPLVLANGKVVFNTIRIEREVHPELSAAAALDLAIVGAQLLFDSDVTNFWSVGSTA